MGVGCLQGSIRDIDYSWDNKINYSSIYSEREEIKDEKEFYDSLRLKEKDIGSLYRIFNRVDKDHSGTIDIIELLMYLDIERTPFSLRCFSVLDVDGSGTVDFKEFVLSCWNYCTLGKSTLLIFTFDVYDSDRTGFLDPSEIAQMLRDIYGEKFMQNAHALSLLKNIELLGDFPIDIDGFRGFARAHQALLFPAFTMQHKLQSTILGVRFWEKLSEMRVELFEGKYVSIERFMDVHTDKDLRETVLRGGVKHVKSNEVTPHNRKKSIIVAESVPVVAPTMTLNLIKVTGSVRQRAGSDSAPSSARSNIQSARSNKSTPRIDDNLDNVGKTPRRLSKDDLGAAAAAAVPRPDKENLGLAVSTAVQKYESSMQRRSMLMKIQSGIELNVELVEKFRGDSKVDLNISKPSDKKSSRRSTFTQPPIRPLLLASTNVHGNTSCKEGILNPTMGSSVVNSVETTSQRRRRSTLDAAGSFNHK